MFLSENKIMANRLDHSIFNERPESQDRLIRLLESMGYEYVSRSDAERKRGNLAKVVFEDELTRYLRNQVYNFNGREYLFSAESITKAVNAVDVPLLQGLMSASKEIYNLLTYGISLEQNIPVDGEAPFKQSFDLKYIDFENPENNIWQVTEEFSVERPDGTYSRPDVVILVNGLPLAVVECKKSSVDAMEGVKQQCRNMLPDYIQQLFKFTQLVMAVNPNRVLYGTAGTTREYFAEWKEDDTTLDLQTALCKKHLDAVPFTVQDRTVVSMLDRKRLLDLIKNFILYDSHIKKICRHQQYFAVNKTIDRINGKDGSDSKNGVIWHTQGSGKSLTMVMLVKKLQSVKAIENPRFLLVTDRINLDKQIRDNFVSTAMAPSRAATGNALKTLVEDTGNNIITTLVNKFGGIAKSGYACKDSANFYVLIDEAHRSHYNSMYNYMLEILPSATFIAFTGTPLIAKKDKNTYKNFGKSIHKYTMKRAIEDGVIVPLVYEGRKVKLKDPNATIDECFESFTAELLPEQKKALKDKFSRYSQLAGTSGRLTLLAWDIHGHFINYCKPLGLKAMIVCSSRAAAVDVYEILTGTFRDIHPAVVITFDNKSEGDDDDTSSAAAKKISDYRKKVVAPLFGDNDAAYDESVCNRFKNPEDDLDILIVKDKLLTGFDAPVAGVIYLDKSIREHSLLQAIARVNRVYPGKDFGLIVDYYGIFTKLNAAIEMYEDAESGFNQFERGDLDQAIFGPIDEKNKLKAAHEKLLGIFDALTNKSRADSNAWQLYLKTDGESGDKRRKEFYQALKEFAVSLNLALTNRAIFIEVGLKQVEKYREDYLFFKKLKDAVMLRYDDNPADLSRYENGIRNLLNTFVTGDKVNIIVEPVSLGDEQAMREILDRMGTSDARADAIRTRMESRLKQVRYDDPLLFEEFSTKIRKTLADYEALRDADKYLADMERIADDFKQGLTAHEYPACIGSDSDTKAFYGAIYTNLKQKATIDLATEELLGAAAKDIKRIIIDNAKRDWKNNLTVHKQIHMALDDCLFYLFDKIGFDINNDSKIVETIDLIIDEIMKVAIVRF
jgi:type I restriction enzyme R subunit